MSILLKIFKTKIVVCITLLVFVISAISIAYINIHSTSMNRLNIKFNENKLNDEQLLNMSDIIIEGKVASLKERVTKNVDTIGADGKKYSISIPYAIYEININDDLYNPLGKKTVSVVMINGSEDGVMKNGKDYVLFLEKVKREDIFKDSYQLVSYSQGVYTLKENRNISSIDNNKEIESVLDSTNKLDYDLLKNKIKAIKKND